MGNLLIFSGYSIGGEYLSPFTFRPYLDPGGIQAPPLSPSLSVGQQLSLFVHYVHPLCILHVVEFSHWAGLDVSYLPQIKVVPVLDFTSDDIKSSTGISWRITSTRVPGFGI